MGILDYLILAGIAVGILAAVRHLKRNSGCGGCGGDCSHCEKKKYKNFWRNFLFRGFLWDKCKRKRRVFFFPLCTSFFTEKQAEKICNFSQINIFSQ